MFLEPPIHIVIVVLLGPQHAGQGLAHHFAFLRRDGGRSHRMVELVGFLLASLQNRFELLKGIIRLCGRCSGEAQIQDFHISAANGQLAMSCRLGPD